MRLCASEHTRPSAQRNNLMLRAFPHSRSLALGLVLCCLVRWVLTQDRTRRSGAAYDLPQGHQELKSGPDPMQSRIKEGIL